MASAKFIVSGLVQGVFFRAATQARARTLGLTGYARNCADGCVEVVASGTPDALAKLDMWLLTGPPNARVDAVEREDLPPQEHTDFARL
jgi:acylphosphatase